ncbi:hypothetical protein EKH55_5224 [Sinorhizobium alkalisoli]|nr:hypothetical protein EKH55_5224 [Sinorhizobium alkalisoli]
MFLVARELAAVCDLGAFRHRLDQFGGLGGREAFSQSKPRIHGVDLFN